MELPSESRDGENRSVSWSSFVCNITTSPRFSWKSPRTTGMPPWSELCHNPDVLLRPGICFDVAPLFTRFWRRNADVILLLQCLSYWCVSVRLQLVWLDPFSRRINNRRQRFMDFIWKFQSQCFFLNSFVLFNRFKGSVRRRLQHIRTQHTYLWY